MITTIKKNLLDERAVFLNKFILSFLFFSLAFVFFFVNIILATVCVDVVFGPTYIYNKLKHIYTLVRDNYK